MKSNFLILIADRNPHVRDLLKRELGEEGYKITVAQNDREVLESVNSENPPSLLILDLAIPYANGVDLVKLLKEIKPAMPIVIHTLFSEYERHPYLRGIEAFLKKKGNIDDLKQTIQRVIEEHYKIHFGH